MIRTTCDVTGSSEREVKSEIVIDAQCRIESLPDSNSKSPLKPPGGKHHSRFVLFANEKNFHFQASDHRFFLLFSALDVTTNCIYEIHCVALDRFVLYAVHKLRSKEKKSRRSWDSNLGLQGGKQECFLCATQPP